MPASRSPQDGPGQGQNPPSHVFVSSAKTLRSLTPLAPEPGQGSLLALMRWGTGLFQEKPHSLQSNIRTSLEKRKRGSGAPWAGRPEATPQGKDWGQVRGPAGQGRV